MLDTLKVTGKKPESGYVVLNEDGDVSLGVVYDKVCFIKGFSDNEITVSDDISKCDYIELREIKEVILSELNKTVVETDNYLGEKDYRYNGPTVNNYVTFSGETWRFIGYINGKPKLVRDDSIGQYKWNEHLNNDWNTSTFQIYLNNEYYNSLSDKDMIVETSYNLGVVDNFETTIDYIYSRENGNFPPPNNPYEEERSAVIENTKIALMYPSDIGYSLNVEYSYDDGFENKTWLYKDLEEYLLTMSDGPVDAIYVSNFGSGYFTHDYLEVDDDWGTITYPRDIRPVLYLKPEVKIKSGTGSSEDPYILSF